MRPPDRCWATNLAIAGFSATHRILETINASGHRRGLSVHHARDYNLQAWLSSPHKSRAFEGEMSLDVEGALNRVQLIGCLRARSTTLNLPFFETTIILRVNNKPKEKQEKSVTLHRFCAKYLPWRYPP